MDFGIYLIIYMVVALIITCTTDIQPVASLLWGLFPILYVISKLKEIKFNMENQEQKSNIDQPVLHKCEAGNDIKIGGYGIAIEGCWEDKDRKLWVGNGEYANTVNYCPFCGYKGNVV